MAARQTTGDMVNELFEIREARREVATEEKRLAAQYKELEEKVLERLEADGTDMARGDLATASISETETPSVTDWKKLGTWIKRNGRLDFFERRISKSAWIEELAIRKGKPIPGIETFTKKTLNLRTR